MTPQTLGRLRDLLRFPEDSAGGLMTTDYLSVRAEMTVAEAVEAIRRVEIDEDTTDAYVVDRAFSSKFST